jgi:hypothetical protein
MLRLRAWRLSTALSVLVVAIQPIPLLESVHLLNLNMFTSLRDTRSASTNENFATPDNTQSATVGM